MVRLPKFFILSGILLSLSLAACSENSRLQWNRSVKTTGELNPSESPVDTDTDDDAVLDEADNCDDVANLDQLDTDSDGVGDACDADIDWDGVANEDDNCALASNADQSDIDSDSLGDVCDDDIDGDGVANADDLDAEDATVLGDADGDGFDSSSDCDDDNADVNPDAIEHFGDSADLNCDDEVLVSAGAADLGVSGAAENAAFGKTVAGVGDFDGDGLGDFLVAATGESEAAGTVYLFLGSAELESSAISATDAFASFTGEAAADAAGTALSSGDFNGDGFVDLAIGAPGVDAGGTDRGRVYLISGSADVSALAGEHALIDVAGLTLTGSADGDALGSAIDLTGDANGDGVNDILISAPAEDAGGTDAGAAYLLFGASDLTGALGFTDLTLINDYAFFYGSGNGDAAGYCVAFVGDLDSDGLDDFAIGAPQSDSGGTDAGRVYLLFGRSVFDDGDSTSLGEYNLTNVDTTYIGQAANGKAGLVIAGGRDINGDGFVDMLISAPYDSEGGTDTGKIYVIFGEASRSDFAFDTLLTDAAASFVGDVVLATAGTALAISDLDDDGGYADLAIGAAGYASDDATAIGRVSVVMGTENLSGAVSLADADANVEGETAEDAFGSALSFASDVNGDGQDDLLIGAPGSDAGATDAGQVYLFLVP